MNDNKKIPYTNHYMINFSDAINLILKNSKPLTTEQINVNQALGRVAAAEVNAQAAIPAFDNSAMDGYAVVAKDLEQASPNSPVTLQLIGLTAAGDNHEVQTGTRNKAWKIMTGAPVPEGFDSIIPVENTQLEFNNVLCFSSPKLAANIRKKGEDFQFGNQVLISGDIINANVIMVLSALGVEKINVFKKTSIAVFSTGKELVDDPKIALKPGQIRNSNQPFILSWLKKLPINIHSVITNHDNIKKFENDLLEALNNNITIIISSGAVSMGDFDFIPKTIKKLGGEIIFHKVKIRPGKPILFAKFPNGSFYFGLPGNPISSIIGLRFFVSTLFRSLLGLTPEKPLVAQVKNNYQKKLGVRSILKATTTINHQAKLEATILDGQESFKIKPLLKANSWVILNEKQSFCSNGDLIELYSDTLCWK